MNSRKTKIMVLNRGNKLIKTDFNLNNIQLEDNKSFKYLEFTISVKNYPFLPTIVDLSTRANRAIYALNNRIEPSKVPLRLALKPWDRTKSEQAQTQFLKRMLVCNVQTSNIMVRGEVGARPLLVEVLPKMP